MLLRGQNLAEYSQPTILYCFSPRHRIDKISRSRKLNQKRADTIQFYKFKPIFVSTSSAGSAGVHWLLLYDQQQQQQNDCWETGDFVFCVWEPLGQPVERYQLFRDHLIKISEKQKLKKFATLDYKSSFHIQTHAVSIASTSRNIWFKKCTKICTLLRLRLYHFVCFSNTKEHTGHRFGFILQWKL